MVRDYILSLVGIWMIIFGMISGRVGDYLSYLEPMPNGDAIVRDNPLFFVGAVILICGGMSIGVFLTLRLFYKRFSKPNL